jgi:CARDB.
MKKTYLLFLILSNFVLPIQASNWLYECEGFIGSDLELTMNSPELNPEVFSNTSADIVITNTGDETATNIIISIELPEGFVLVGSNPFSVTSGDYSSFFGTWTLDELTPGSSETLTLNFFTLTENPVQLYGEVFSADQPDMDSTPDNGTPPSINEDDEAILNFNGIPDPGLPDLTIDQIIVPSSITLNVPITIEYQSSNIGEATADGPITTFIYFSEDNELNAGDQQFDQVTIESIPAGGVIGEEIEILVLSSLGITPGTGYIIMNIDNDNEIEESNENNNVFVSDQITFNSIPNNGEIDLELSLNQPVENPIQFSTYSVQLSVFNNENSTATNVEVSIPRPFGVVFTGNNPFETNIGEFNVFNGIFSISSLPPGATAEITLNYFLLEPEAPIVYAQVTQATETDSDSTPNNGTPPTPNEDDEASTESGTPPMNLPDLFLGEVEAPSIIFKGISTSINYQLENLGTSTAAGSFTVFLFYSGDDQLDMDGSDILFAQKSFNDFPAGNISDEVFDFALLPNSNIIPNGLGYVILKVDFDDVIMESNENNNVVTSPVYIGSILENTECATNLINGTLNCVQDTPEGGQEFYFTMTNDAGIVNGFLQVTDENGSLISNEALGEIPPEITFETFSLTGQNDRIRILENGILVDEIDIPNSILDNFDEITGATTFNDGFILFAVLGSDLIAILTDASLNPIMENVLPSLASSITVPSVSRAIQIAPNQVGLVFTENNGLAGTLVGLMVIDDNLMVLSNEFLNSGQFASGDLKQTICGDFRLDFSTFSFGGGGESTSSTTAFGSFVDGEFIEVTSTAINSFESNSPNPSENFSSTNYSLQTSDGGQVQVSNLTPSQLLIEKILNGNIISSTEIDPIGFIVRPVEISGEIFLVAREDPSLVQRLFDLNCLDNTTTTNDGVDLELSSELSVSNPDIFSNYSVVYTLVNNGTETATGIEVEFILPTGTVYVGGNEFSISIGNVSPIRDNFTLNELLAGETAVIQLNYFSLTDSPIDHYAEVVALNEDDVDSTPDNGTPPTVNEDDETAISTGLGANTNEASISTNETGTISRLEILNLFPNPVMDKDIRLALNIPEATDQTFLLYNELGVEVIRKQYELNKGFNSIILPTKNLPGGVYRVILPGHPSKFGSASFMVIK